MTSSLLKIAIILGSTRPGRNGKAVAKWAYDIAQKRSDAGFIGYGFTKGARAIEHLRLVMAAVQVATVRPQVGLSLFTDFENSTVFKPAPTQETNVSTMLDHVVAWSGAFRALREKRGEKR